MKMIDTEYAKALGGQDIGKLRRNVKSGKWDIEARLNGSQTAIMIASGAGAIKSLDFLLGQGANLMSSDLEVSRCTYCAESDADQRSICLAAQQKKTSYWGAFLQFKYRLQSVSQLYIKLFPL